MARRNERQFQLPLFERERRRPQDRLPQRRFQQQGFLQQGRRQERNFTYLLPIIVIVSICTERYDSSWFLEKIYHIATLLDTHFPYGALGIAFSLLFIITLRLIIVQKNFHHLSAQHNEIFNFLLEEHMRRMDIHENFHHLSAEYSDIHQKFQRLSAEHDKCSVIKQNFQRLSADHNRCRKDKKKLESKLKHMTLLSQKETEKSKKQKQQLEICIEELEKSVQDEEDKRLCIICDDQNRTIVLLPCKHMCMCKTCLGRQTWKTCPLCREPVDTDMEIYV